jgi:ankyrin repeat protein
MPPKPKAKTAGAGALAAAARPYRLPVSGLEVGLLDVGRFVALNGYAHECRRLPFLSRAFRREEDFLVACKRVRYGGKGRTRLMSLAMMGDVERVSLLLKVGADVEARDASSFRPLHFAIFSGREAVVRQLLERGADVRAATKNGATPLHIASHYGHAAVVRLLLDRGADMRAAMTDGSTPLHAASQYGCEPVVRLLLNRGADMRAALMNGATPLHIASSRATSPSSVSCSTGAQT